MKKSIMEKIKVSVFIAVILLFVGFSIEAAPTAAPTATQDDLKYQVDVSRQLLPVYAVDSKGQPVFDLKQEELQLEINGKPEPIDFISRVYFEHEIEVKRKDIKSKDKKVPQKKIVPKHPGRMIFIMVDGMFNSAYGLRRSKKIVGQLVAQRSPNDIFVILQSNHYGEIKKIVGPEKRLPKLKKAIRKISTRPESLLSKDLRDVSNRRFMTTTQSETVYLGQTLDNNKAAVKAKFFCDFISRLKYMLEAITMPKVLFIISEGIPEILSYRSTAGVSNNIFFSTDLHERIMKIAKEINEGGSMLYTVYSGRVKAGDGQTLAGIVDSSAGSGLGSLEASASEFTASNSSDNQPFAMDSGTGNLKNMAIASKGKYFEGSAGKIATEIKQATAAYYELAFFPKGRKAMKIDLKCLRKGVTISTLGHTSTRKPYSQMNTIRKKVFAMNVVLGRQWALNMCKFEKSPFRLQDEKQEQGVKIAEILTGKLQDRKVEKFLIRFDKDLKNADVKVYKGVLKKKTALEFKQVKDNDKLFFVIIDPETTQCIYNRIM
ncbi:MAG: hypothetical protein GY757_44700 [bacterium]|nr:hypothetical protein [bacterium]